MYNPDEVDFCYYPFFQVLVSAEGRYKPCSKHEDFVTHNGEVLEVSKATIKDAWNSDYMLSLRDNFKKNIRTKGCMQCWKEQSLGLKPMRFDSYNYNIPISQVDNPISPMRIEINASNVCNLRCRICWSHASTKWIKEAKELYGVDGEVHMNLTDENFSIIKGWVPHLIEIGFFGGEPLMDERNIQLMQYCVEEGYAKNITLLINTNCTVYSDEIASLFTEFKKVLLNFSIDDIGKRYEYERGYAKWDLVVNNMRKYIEHGGITPNDKVECKICCSVSIMNIYYFPEYFEYMNENFPGLSVYWNLVYVPWALSMQILPKEVKELIADRLRKYVRTTYNLSEQRTKTIENLITFLHGSEIEDFNDFFRHVVRHDKYRQESFPEVFPEFWNIIEKYKPADIEMHYETQRHLNKNVLHQINNSRGILAEKYNYSNEEPYIKRVLEFMDKNEQTQENMLLVKTKLEQLVNILSDQLEQNNLKQIVYKAPPGMVAEVMIYRTVEEAKTLLDRFVSNLN